MRSPLRSIQGLIVIIYVAGMLSFALFAHAKGDLYGLYQLARECLVSREKKTCRLALIQLEGLQRAAAAQRNYPCQTRLLGLGSDLIMSEEGVARGQPVNEILEEVSSFCLEL